MQVDICIPTMRMWHDLQDLIEEIEVTVSEPRRIIASCQPVSAACNRNICLEHADTDVIIMLDDDMTGFFPGWDKQLLAPLEAHKDVCMTSARLLDPNGAVQATCMDNYDLTPDWLEIPVRDNAVVPSACVAFRDCRIRFDEHFIGSGWEDTDFCRQFTLLPGGPVRFMVVNSCQLIHKHEQKQQAGRFWEANSQYFANKWKALV